MAESSEPKAARALVPAPDEQRRKRHIVSAQESRAFATALMQGAASYPSMQIIRAPEYRGDSTEVERAEYAISLLPKEAQDEVLAEREWTAKEIQSLILSNTAATRLGEGEFRLSGDIIYEIDKHIRRPVFITGSTKVYTEEDLLRIYPFKELGSSPMKVFAQQELGLFPARYSSDPDAREFQVRDLGEEEEFVAIEDFVGRMARVGYKDKRKIITSVKTKVFLARDAWDDFQELAKQMRIIARFGPDAAHQAASSGKHNFLSLMMGGMVNGAAAPTPALENAQLIEERMERARLEHEEREKRLKEREEALARETERLMEMLGKMSGPAGEQ